MDDEEITLRNEMREKTKLKNEKVNKLNNDMTSILNGVTWVIVVIGFIAGLIYADTSFIITLYVWIATSLSALFIFAFAEIIQILHDIRRKIWKQK